MAQSMLIPDEVIGKMARLMAKILHGVATKELDPETVLRCLDETAKSAEPTFENDMRKQGW